MNSFKDNDNYPTVKKNQQALPPKYGNRKNSNIKMLNFLIPLLILIIIILIFSSKKLCVCPIIPPTIPTIPGTSQSPAPMILTIPPIDFSNFKNDPDALDLYNTLIRSQERIIALNHKYFGPDPKAQHADYSVAALP